MNSDSDVLIDEIRRRLRTVVGDAPVALHEPCFDERCEQYVVECVRSGWVSSVGRFVNRFESELAAFTGVRHAVAVVNGTAALHMALHLVGVERADEVLCPALSFVATANAVSYCGAVPHFVDVDEATLGVSPDKLADHLAGVIERRQGVATNRFTGRRIRAVVPMHAFGHPVDIDPLVDLCQRYGLRLVEDAAESLGSYYRGRHTGGFGDTAAVSFNGNKIMTTGGGGAILTNDDDLAAAARHLTTTAKVPHSWQYVHDRVGYNYRLPNLNAALGCAQLEQLPELIDRKRALAARYRDAFADCPEATILPEQPFARSNCWLNVLLVDPAIRDDVLQVTNDSGVMTRPPWNLLSELPMYSSCPSMDLTTSRRLQQSALNIPSSASLQPAVVVPVGTDNAAA